MKLGFIGCGNMAQAMIKGITSTNKVKAEDIMASTRTRQSLEKVKSEFKINVTHDNKEVAEQSQIVILAVKPQYYASVIKEIRNSITDSTIILTVAPGKSLAQIEEMFGTAVKVVRCMPNTPAMVGEAMTAVASNDFVTDTELQQVLSLIEGFGKAAVVSESLMDAVVTVSGSSPAYVYMFIEALADGAVREGMTREMAYAFAAQAVYGAAKMVLETGLHPGQLKDMVCSPAGTTIEAVRILEEKGFRSAVLEAMKTCGEKAKTM